MKIVNRSLGDAANASAARKTAFRELSWLAAAACLLGGAIFFGVGIVVDATVSRISPEAEASLFASLRPPNLVRKRDAPRLRQARTILKSLASAPQVPELPYRLVLLDIEAPNAFAFPGGTIGVTKGLLDALNQEIALAFVLGHELGHFHSRDHLRGIGRAIGFGVAGAVLFGGQMGSDSAAGIFNLVMHRTYSRAQEEKADRFGAECVFHTYGRTDGVDRLFRILEDKAECPRWAYMFATHPSPQSRIRELRTHAAQLGGSANER